MDNTPVLILDLELTFVNQLQKENMRVYMFMVIMITNFHLYQQPIIHYNSIDMKFKIDLFK